MGPMVQAGTVCIARRWIAQSINDRTPNVKNLVQEFRNRVGDDIEYTVQAQCLLSNESKWNEGGLHLRVKAVLT